LIEAVSRGIFINS